jgi:hypothetical protein
MIDPEAVKDLELISTLFWSAAVDLKHANGVMEDFHRRSEGDVELQALALANMTSISQMVADLTESSEIIDQFMAMWRAKDAEDASEDHE